MIKNYEIDSAVDTLKLIIGDFESDNMCALAAEVAAAQKLLVDMKEERRRMGFLFAMVRHCNPTPTDAQIEESLSASLDSDFWDTH